MFVTALLLFWALIACNVHFNEHDYKCNITAVKIGHSNFGLNTGRHKLVDFVQFKLGLMYFQQNV